MNNSFNSLIKLILPEGLEEYFELTSHTNEGATFHLYLKELNILPTYLMFLVRSFKAVFV